MKNCLPVILVVFFSFTLQAQSPVVQEAARLEEGGKFKEADSLLRAALEKEPQSTADSRKLLEFELDRLERIRQDYSLTKERLFSQLEKSIKGITRSEFERWILEGKLDIRTIDGVQYFVGVSRSNLFWRYPEIAARRIDASDDSAFERAVWESCVAIKKASSNSEPYVMPKQFKVVMKVKAKANAVPAGERVRAWLPIPRKFPFQTDFKLISSSSEVKISDEESTIRSAYLEQMSAKDQPTEFKIEYTYSTMGIHFDLKPEQVLPYDSDDPVVRQFTKEGPHVVFTDKIKKLSDEFVGKETNSLNKARAFYDWITMNIKYSYALEYSTMRNISDYCLTKMYGDCGQEALLFITLCRYNGVPARWQSGWFTFPGGKTIHDWTEIYVKPWGWVPVDPYMGIFAVRYLKSLSDEQKEEVRQFYFGGLDHYRMSANSDHNQELNPPKRSMRSDNVDFQRGELEYGETNIYFDKYSFSLEIEEITKTP
ncbi:MAG: transglutaminase domain-containing protein [Ignavibacteriales bacterium]|nr:transglutaminase domain-containing protein [Ignavibacteriales bacterium]